MRRLDTLVRAMLARRREDRPRVVQIKAELPDAIAACEGLAVTAGAGSEQSTVDATLHAGRTKGVE